MVRRWIVTGLQFFAADDRRILGPDRRTIALSRLRTARITHVPYQTFLELTREVYSPAWP